MSTRMNGITTTPPPESLRPAKHGSSNGNGRLAPPGQRVSIPALRMIPAPHSARLLAGAILLLLTVLPVVLVLTPWQQNVVGAGRVVAYTPYDREQPIAAPVSGRVVEWSVIEGSQVKAGDLIVRMSDNDPDLMTRIRQQLDAAEQKLRTAREKVQLYGEQARGWEEARDFAVAAARSQASAAARDVEAAQQALIREAAELEQKRLNRDRQKELAENGVASRYTFELADREFKTAQAKVAETRAKLAAVEQYRTAKEAELGQKQREAQIKIDEAGAKVQSAQGEVAEAEKELADVRVKLNRQGAQEVRAPRDGTILRLLAQPNANQVKQGDPLAIFVPQTDSRSVELWVDGNDAPLIERGRRVRLQFEGWPAVQFAGWPSVAVGTFGGIVSLVDATDNGKGRFRLLIQPDPADQPWPRGRFLRQGVRAHGWVLLDSVPLWYEIWRQLNGFPPVVSMEEPGSADSAEGKGKKTAR